MRERKTSGDGTVSYIARDPREDIWSVGPFGVQPRHRSFRIDYRGRVVLHRLPFLVWLLITGVASSALSVLTVWAVWG